MKIAVLTIPSQRHRVWALMGHLSTLGFPVRSDRFTIYNGFSYEGYPTRESALIDMIADGHTKYAKYLESADDTLRNLDSHLDMCEWGMLNIMRKVIETNSFTMVMENDAYFRNVPVTDPIDSFPFFVQKFYDLRDAVGYENINVAMFTVIRPNLDYRQSQMTNYEEIDEFWVKGARGPGQTCNIYTPHGAEYILNEKSPYPNIEAYLFFGDTPNDDYVEIPGVYSTKAGMINMHFFSNFDSPHTIDADTDHYTAKFQGEQL